MTTQPRIYKGFEIVKTEHTTTVKKLLPGYSFRYYDSVENLYEIVGLKKAGCRPFITSLSHAKSYISEALESCAYTKN